MNAGSPLRVAANAHALRALGAILQEYLGSYVTDASGRLVFQEGALLTALRRGQWLVLDELNLAPSEVLEALNRWAHAASGPGVVMCCMVSPLLAAKCHYAVGGAQFLMRRAWAPTVRCTCYVLLQHADLNHDSLVGLLARSPLQQMVCLVKLAGRPGILAAFRSSEWNTGFWLHRVYQKHVHYPAGCWTTTGSCTCRSCGRRCARTRTSCCSRPKTRRAVRTRGGARCRAPSGHASWYSIVTCG